MLGDYGICPCVTGRIVLGISNRPCCIHFKDQPCLNQVYHLPILTNYQPKVHPNNVNLCLPLWRFPTEQPTTILFHPNTWPAHESVMTPISHSSENSVGSDQFLYFIINFPLSSSKFKSSCMWCCEDERVPSRRPKLLARCPCKNIPEELQLRWLFWESQNSKQLPCCVTGVLTLRQSAGNRHDGQQ